ncbi:MAG TPA: hypothetical protein C5S50_02715 [Methanosarcinaceae archaeon]|nr:hypothetical protein [Methanosarcinaceae archaeon]
MDTDLIGDTDAYGFRHGRLTDLSKQGFNEMELRTIAGWTKESGMSATYLHLSGGDVKNKILANHGIIEDETKMQQETLKPVECPRCKTKNPPDAKPHAAWFLMLRLQSNLIRKSKTQMTI